MKNELELIQSMIDSADASIYLKDGNGRILAANQRVAELWNKSLDEIIGKTDYDFASKEDADRFRAHDREVVEADEPKTFRDTLTTPNGPVEIFDHKFPVHLDGYPGAVGGIAIEAKKLAA